MLRLTSVLVEATEPPNQPGSVPQPSVTESTDNWSNLLINDQIDLTKVKITPSPPKKTKQKNNPCASGLIQHQ